MKGRDRRLRKGRDPDRPLIILAIGCAIASMIFLVLAIVL